MSRSRIYITVISSKAAHNATEAGESQEVLPEARNRNPRNDQTGKEHEKRNDLRNKNNT